MQIWLKRAYAEPGRADGRRILVDRVWPRGVSKEELQLDDWLKAIAPSKELRQWFDHDSERWPEFKQRYFKELENNPAPVERLLDVVGDGRVTLVYGAKDTRHNNAVALKEYLEDRSAS